MSKKDSESNSKAGAAAQSEKGKARFLKRRDEIRGRVERLELLFEMIGKTARSKTCEAIQGVISDGEKIIEEFKGFPTLVAGLISAARAVGTTKLPVLARRLPGQTSST